MYSPQSNSFVETFGTRPRVHHGDPAWLEARRKEALSAWSHLGLPTKRNEDWKYSGLSHLQRHEWQPVEKPNGEKERYVQALEAYRLPDAYFFSGLDGHVTCPREERNLPSRMWAGSLWDVPSDKAAYLQEHFAGYADSTSRSFCAFNTAWFADAFCLFVPEGVKVQAPVQVLFANTGKEGRVVWPRLFVFLGQGAELTLIESHVGLEKQRYMSAPVSEMIVGDQATLNYHRLVEEGEKAHHVATVQFEQKAESTVKAHTFSLSGSWVRNELNSFFDGERSHCTFNGLYLADENQHVDTHTAIDHAKPNCQSVEMYNGILAGKSQGVFNGKVFVRKQANKTNARQNNMNLLLSRDAVINTKPQLEIFSDDVKCTHGATIGQLDDAALFFLRSRGLDRAEATKLLVYGFASERISELTCAPLRSYLEQRLAELLPLGRQGTK